MAGLLDVLTEEAEAQREKILDGAETKSREILHQAEAEAENLQEKSFHDCDEKLRLEKGRSLGAAQLYARNLMMQAKHEVLEEAFKKALSSLSDLRKRSEYAEIFHRFASETLDQFEGENIDNVIVFVDERDLRLCRDFLDNRKISYEIDTGKTFLGGLEIVASDASFKVTNTLEGRLAKEKDGLLGKLAHILFEDEK
ncbi:MAG: hypothetical protein GY801_21965 [bacterium]|nr:hypothetical protein [bacterium]